MKQTVTEGIILSRSNYGEADRIITFLTKDAGKISVIAKSVRKSQSKLAGSVELFSVSQITFIEGRGELKTLISARLVKHYGKIVKNLKRTNQAYDFMKTLGRATEEAAEPAYFDLLNKALKSLDDEQLEPNVTLLWFNMQLLKLAGHIPNLHSDSTGAKLSEGESYSIDFEKMCLAPAQKGRLNSKHIKFLRIGFGAKGPNILQRVKGFDQLAELCQPIIQTMLKSHVRV